MAVHELLAFLLAASIGGVTQPLIGNKGVLRTPSFDRVKRELDFGFLADMVVGMVAATAALIVGMAVLKALLPPVATAEGSGLAMSPSVIREFPRWVYLASFGALVGFGGGRLLPALSQRMIDAIEYQVEMRTEQAKKGVAQISAGATESMLDTVRGLQQAVSDLAKSGSSPRVAAAEPATGIEELVRGYDAIDEADYTLRLQRKNEVFQRMTGLCSAHTIDTTPLLAKLEAGGSDAYALALAAWVAARPGAGTAELLLRAGPRASRLHVKYQIASALGLIASARRMSQAEAGRAATLLVEFTKNADAPLLRRIAATRGAVSAVLSDPA